MKIELENNKVFFENQGLKKEIHPFWLRERVNGDNFVDKKTLVVTLDAFGDHVNYSAKLFEQSSKGFLKIITNMMMNGR